MDYNLNLEVKTDKMLMYKVVFSDETFFADGYIAFDFLKKSFYYGVKVDNMFVAEYSKNVDYNGDKCLKEQFDEFIDEVSKEIKNKLNSEKFEKDWFMC